MSFYLGCAVWAYRGWIGEFYPPGSDPQDLLRLYGQRLTCVEGNTTFYAIPQRAQLRAWAQQLPPGFKLCPKLHRSLTHEGLLWPRMAKILEFGQLMTELGSCQGPMMMQLPPSYGPSCFEDLARVLDAWPAQLGQLVVEVRHLGWWAQPVGRALAGALGVVQAGRVLLDVRPVYEGPGGDPQLESERRKPAVPLVMERTSDTVVIRYIGHPEPARNEPYLDEWAPAIKAWLERGVTVYFFAHCPVEARSPRYARAMHERLVALGAPVGPLPWAQAPAQLGLF